MQFFSNGPDIPDSLLQAHEEGRVVFFCGAGISRRAGLPDFGGLVQKLFQKVGEPADKVESELIEKNQFDRAIGHYEQRIQGGRTTTRRTLPSIFSIDLTKRHALTTHFALLTLGRSNENENDLKLVTTNFDILFEKAAAHYGLPSPTVYPDPPTRNRWNGIVHLHGRMPLQPSEDDLDQLVLSDGDFGQAYLTQGWAAQFVAKLFRDYTLCFVGYSIDDPVLRYMTAAHALDGTQKMFAFASFESGKKESALRAWEDKHVVPILYDDAAFHRSLHQTLHIWASVYRDCINGKKRLITRYVHRLPKDSTPQNDFVGRMLWALSDPSGLPAKHFANFNPAPPLEWLFEAFSPPPDHTKPSFNLMRRSAPHHLMPPMQLVSMGNTESGWDVVMSHLAQWLVRHLGDSRLILWVAEQGGQLHHRWQYLIEERLNQLYLLEQKGKASELEEIRLHAPNAIPNPMMRTLWRFLLSGRVKSPIECFKLYDWKDNFKREGMTSTLRLALRQLLTPKLTLKRPYIWSFNDLSSHADKSMQLEQWTRCELELTAAYVKTVLNELAENEDWRASLPLLIEDFQQLLRDALDLLRELGKADDRHDPSYLILPSITPHWQNQEEPEDWRILIERVCEAWLAVRAHNPARATRIAQDWFEHPYPTFKRLALFAASQNNCISSEQWVDWLLDDEAWWLWTIDTGREVCRLLVLQGQNLTRAAQARLETTILAGPPRKMYPDNLEEKSWQNLVARLVWLHLSKLNASGLTLGVRATTRLNEISAAYPQWQLASNERDEFSYWSSGTGDPDYEEKHDTNIAPRKRQDLVPWLKNPLPEGRPFYGDTWHKVCQKNPLNSLFALADLAQQDHWPFPRWKSALHTWSERKKVQRMWCYAAPLVQTMPDAVLQTLANDVTRWLEVVSTSIHHHEEIFLDLCRRVLELPLDICMTQDSDTVSSEKSHAIGYTTQALINLWFKHSPNDNDLLPDTLKPLFTMLCDVKEDRFRHGRVLIGSKLISFFRIDRPWTEQYLLPLFNWSNPVEAKAVWEGFLLSPRLHLPLLIAIKPFFLESARHYVDLGERRQQFARFMTHLALNQTDGYTVKEFRSAIDELPEDGLETSVLTLCKRLEGAAAQREVFWKNHVQPFWHKIWPKSRDRLTAQISEHLARLVIAAGDAFPAALNEVKDWLQPIKNPDHMTHRLHKSGLCVRFPKDALTFLKAIITDPRHSPSCLSKCLEEMKQNDPTLTQSTDYQQLLAYATRC